MTLLHNNIEEIPRLTSFLDLLAAEKKIDADSLGGINLALEEAATNVIMYAYPEGTDGILSIEAIPGDGFIEFVMSDSGKAFDPTAMPDADVTASADDRPIGGLGIFLVRQIMDEVSYERSSDKNILKMKKHR